MKNKKIEFQKLVDRHCPYSLCEQIQILEWMFKTSKSYAVSLGKWHLEGFDSLVYDYSANDYKSYTAIESKSQIRTMFVNAIVATTCIQKWRDDLGIKLGLSKFFNFKLEDNEHLWFGHNRDIFEIMKLLPGAKLNEHYLFRNYSDRVHPFIKSIKFTISYVGCHICLDYTFDTPGYERCAWTKEFWKTEESLEEFFLASFRTIDSWLEHPFILEGKEPNSDVQKKRTIINIT